MNLEQQLMYISTYLPNNAFLHKKIHNKGANKKQIDGFRKLQVQKQHFLLLIEFLDCHIGRKISLQTQISF